jgi:hypothetical protein
MHHHDGRGSTSAGRHQSIIFFLAPFTSKHVRAARFLHGIRLKVACWADIKVPHFFFSPLPYIVLVHLLPFMILPWYATQGGLL